MGQAIINWKNRQQAEEYAAACQWMGLKVDLMANTTYFEFAEGSMLERWIESRIARAIIQTNVINNSVDKKRERAMAQVAKWQALGI